MRRVIPAGRLSSGQIPQCQGYHVTKNSLPPHRIAGLPDYVVQAGLPDYGDPTRSFGRVVQWGQSGGPQILGSIGHQAS